MAITNKEIITSQVRRINKKAGTNLLLRKANGHWYLCREVNGNELEPYPFSGTKTRRTSAQMIEYLAGLEDAIDARPTTIYYVRCEVNDTGWINGHHFFTKLEDAIKLMRNHVALQIWLARAEKKKVSLKILGDSVMGDVSENPKKSPAIIVRIDDDLFEYRIWGDELHASEISRRESICY